MPARRPFDAPACRKSLAGLLAAHFSAIRTSDSELRRARFYWRTQALEMLEAIGSTEYQADQHITVSWHDEVTDRLIAARNALLAATTPDD